MNVQSRVRNFSDSLLLFSGIADTPMASGTFIVVGETSTHMRTEGMVVRQ